MYDLETRCFCGYTMNSTELLLHSLLQKCTYLADRVEAQDRIINDLVKKNTNLDNEIKCINENMNALKLVIDDMLSEQKYNNHYDLGVTMDDI